MFDIATGTVEVAKDIHINHPVSPIVGFGGPLMTRTGTLKAESSLGSEDIAAGKDAKNDFSANKVDNNLDNQFIEDVCPPLFISCIRDPHHRAITAKDGYRVSLR
jgi:hypothetical protein